MRPGDPYHLRTAVHGRYTASGRPCTNTGSYIKPFQCPYTGKAVSYPFHARHASRCGPLPTVSASICPTTSWPGISTGWRASPAPMRWWTRRPTRSQGVGHRRSPGRRPRATENRHNAWFVKASIREEYRGRLAGKTLAVKDSICVAGLPMMNGASFLEGTVPDTDASVVTRALHAGAEIVGKTNCEYLSLSGGSHTCANGPVVNPHKEGYSAGGSSSGSAVAVAVGDAGMALGCDQAGSIRVPAAWCGIVGLKPTHGLVPYTGILGVGPGRGPLRPHDQGRRHQRPAAGGARRTRRHGPASATLLATRGLHQSAQGRRQGFARGRGERRLRAPQRRSRSR